VEGHHDRQGQDLKPEANLTEQERAQRLRRMKRIPLWLLLLMAVLFAVTMHHPETWAGWVHAFAEAGMVGALADWFAVVALFKHPLGIPIPHTAIIPTRKNELGEAMARFVADHFLEPAVVRVKLHSVNLAGFTVDWLRSARGRASVQDFGAGMLRWALDALHEERVREFLSRLSRRQLKDVSLAPMLGHSLDWLVRDNRHQDILTHMLRYCIVVLNDNRDTIRDRVQQKSPWWIPGFVDDRILQQMLERIETQLFEMALDSRHPLRGKFNQWLLNLARELKTSPEHRRVGQRLKHELLENDALQDYLYGIWEELSGRLEQDLDRHDSKVREQIGDWVDNVATELGQDGEMQAWINGWLTDSVVLIVDRNRDQIASLISDTVKSWDGRDTSRRVELAIGRDLQFIRINGTLVGGLVGVVIHAASLI
jgi:uncharacterized membrane-anchored protein YjiN (DUF445 family)